MVAYRFEKLLLLVGVFLLLNVTLPAQERVWNTFGPRSGEWSISSPGPLAADSEALAPDSFRGSYSYNDFSGFFTVIYRDFPKIKFSPFATSHKSYLNKTRDEAVKAVNGTLMGETPYAYAGHGDGKEIFIKMVSGTVAGRETAAKTVYRIERARMFFVARRFYVVMAVLPEDEINTPAINKFFDSFTVKKVTR